MTTTHQKLPAPCKRPLPSPSHPFLGESHPSTLGHLLSTLQYTTLYILHSTALCSTFRTKTECHALYVCSRPCMCACVRVVRCFPGQMVQRAEALNPVNANAPRLELRADGRVHRRRVHNEQRVDSLFQLFNPNLPSDSGTAICYLIAFSSF